MNPKKCNSFQTHIKFLGHTISEEGVSVNDDKIKVIKDHPVPNNKKQLKSFLGLVNYYRKYIPNVAHISEPLNYLLRKNIPFVWSEKCQASFQKFKDLLTSAPILAFPNFDLEFQLSVDACGTSIGFVLSQKQDGCDRILAFGGRSLNQHERNYSINELEALSVVEGIKYFHVYLYGRKFTVYTDNSSITWLYKQKTPTGRIARWIFRLLEYDFEIIYKPGKLNANADAISRIPNLPQTLTIAEGIDSSKDDFLREQALDHDLLNIVNVLKSDKTDKISNKLRKNFVLDPDGLLWKIVKKCKPYDSKYRLVVPSSMKAEILHTFHDSIFGGHRGVNTTFNKIHDRYYWRYLYKEVKNYCQTCQKCIFTKPSPQLQAPLLPLATTEPFENVYMDIVGPLPESSSGNKYILNFVDSLTKWSESIPLVKTDSVIVAKALYENIVCRHGTPQNLITDSAKNFMADFLTELCKLLNVKKIHIAPYHPSALGTVEGYNGTLVRMISLYISENQKDWDKLLPGILFAYHTSRHDSTSECPFTLLYGPQSSLTQ